MYNVLVCDDDREIVEAIEIYLSQEGYKVLKAYDGEEALKVLDREKVDLLIIDVMMPKLDGKKVVTVSVEGPSDENAIGGILKDGVQ